MIQLKVQIKSKLKSIDTVDKQACNLLKEKRKSVTIDRDIVEGILKEMQSEMEQITRLANEGNSEDAVTNQSEDEMTSSFKDVQFYFDYLSHELKDLSYDDSDVLEIASQKLNKLQVNSRLNFSSFQCLVSICFQYLFFFISFYLSFLSLLYTFF